VLAFAVEEKMANDPEANQVSWLGTTGDEDVLAVADKSGLEHLQQALASVGIHVDEVHSETLLLPLQAGEWSVVWNGSDGFVRSGEFEGAAMDCGDRESPPLSLLLMLKEAKARDVAPASLALYVTAPDVLPNIPSWQDALGVTLRIAGTWDWRSAAPDGAALVAAPTLAGLS
jgi:general secretion pathway protein L